MLRSRELVALRYEGTLCGSGAVPISVLFVESEQFASEFVHYLGSDRVHPVAPVETLFRGSLLASHCARARLKREAERADIVIRHWLLGPSRREGEVSHYPMLEGTLPVQADIEAQIGYVHSAAHRRRLRSALMGDSYGSTVSADERAFAEFYDTMYEPYVRGRFGDDASVKSRAPLLELFRQQGRIIQVTRAGKPIASAFLVPLQAGVLSYDSNGFGGDALSPDTLAQYTAALELAVLRHAIEFGFRAIAFGYARARFADGLFTHKRRMGCSFAPADYSPLVRINIKPSKRPAVFQAFPLLATENGEFVTHLGLDVAEPERTVRQWRTQLKTYVLPGVRRIVLHTNAAPTHPARIAYETALREIAGTAIEVLRVP
ncbi:MAG TPA: hypothetical protein VIK01_28385 [Polyangiaceae bacterium]